MEPELQFIKVFARPRNFIGLTFLLSWILWIPLVLLRLGAGSLQLSDTTYTLLSFLGVLMPAVAALILTARDRETRFLLSRLTLWRVHWKWWAAAVLVQPGLLFLTGLIYALLYGTASVERIQQPAVGAMVVNVIFLLLATLGEEIGWRGVALPAFELKHNALKASLLLGIIYVAWHTPYWLIVGTMDRTGLFYSLLNVFFAFAVTIYVTWFFNGARFSILLPVAFHITFNTVNGLIFPLTSNVTAYGILIVLEWIIALLLMPVLRSEQITSREKSF